MDFRKKFIEDNLKECYKDYDLLTDWEKEFLISIKALQNNIRYTLSSSQFNSLRNIVTRLRKL